MLRVLAVVLLAGCVTIDTDYTVPSSTAGRSCYRECLGVLNACRAADSAPLLGRCEQQNQECLASCPGAYDRTTRLAPRPEGTERIEQPLQPPSERIRQPLRPKDGAR